MSAIIFAYLFCFILLSFLHIYSYRQNESCLYACDQAIGFAAKAALRIRLLVLSVCTECFALTFVAPLHWLPACHPWNHDHS